MSDVLLIAFPAACFTACTVIVLCACVTAGRADERLQGFRTFSRDSPPVTAHGPGAGSSPASGHGFEEWDIEAEWASLHWGETA